MNYKDSQGYSLIELMVALLLGLLVSGAALQLYLTSQVSLGTQSAASQAQDKGRFAMDQMLADLRRAGETPSNSQYITSQAVGLPSEVATTMNTSWPTSLTIPPDTDPITGSNAFAVTYYADPTVATPTDCNGFPTTITAGVSQITNIYFVAKASSYTTANPIMSLWCEGNGTVPTGISPSQELLKGINVMRVLYGADNLVDGVLSPSIWISDPNSLNTVGPPAVQIPVVGARVAILVQSDNSMVNLPTQATSIQVLNCVVPTNCATTVNLADGFLRRLFVGSTLLRNNLNPGNTSW